MCTKMAANSAQFLVVIKNMSMIPFDVVSLSMGTPLDLALETIGELLLRIPLSIATVTLMHLLNHSLINYFPFNGKFD